MQPYDPTYLPLGSTDDAESSFLISEVRASMTLIMARAQLLRRRIKAGRVTDVDACLPTLAHITEGVCTMEARTAKLKSMCTLPNRTTIEADETTGPEQSPGRFGHLSA